MASTYFDTHDYIIQLAASGIPTEEAEAHAKALGIAMNNELAKKSDLNALRAETKADLNALRAEIKSDLNAFRTEAKADLNAFKAEAKADLNTFKADAKADLNTFKAETRGQFELLKWMMGFVLAGIAAMTFKMFH